MTKWSVRHIVWDQYMSGRAFTICCLNFRKGRESWTWSVFCMAMWERDEPQKREAIGISGLQKGKVGSHYRVIHQSGLLGHVEASHSSTDGSPCFTPMMTWAASGEWQERGGTDGFNPPLCWSPNSLGSDCGHLLWVVPRSHCSSKGAARCKYPHPFGRGQEGVA